MLPHSGAFLPVRDRGTAIVKIQTLGAAAALLLTGPVSAQPAPHPDPVDASKFSFLVRIPSPSFSRAWTSSSMGSAFPDRTVRPQVEGVPRQRWIYCF